MSSYKKGIADQAKIDAEKERQYERTLNKLAEGNRQWRNRYGKFVDIILEDMSREEKKHLYGIVTPFDIAELDRAEQELLISILWELSLHHTRPQTEQNELLQQMFVRSVQQHLGIMDIQNDEISLSDKIHNIDSKRSEEAILQVIMEYLSLENNNHGYLINHNDIILMFEYAGKKQEIIDRIQKSIDDYVSAVGIIGLANKYSYIEFSGNSEELIPEKYRIDIKYEKQDSTAVDLLKGALENYKNKCSLSEIIKGHECPSGGEYDFTIIVGKNIASERVLSFGKQQKIYDTYGCSITSPEGSNIFVLQNNDTFDEYNRNDFLNYYIETCLSESGVKNSKAKKLAEKRRTKKTRSWRIWEGLSSFPEWAMDKINIEEDSDNWGIILLKGLATIAMLPVGLVSFAASFVIGLPEEFIQDRVKKLQDSNFDKKFVEEAQKDILVVKIAEYIVQEQYKNAK